MILKIEPGSTKVSPRGGIPIAVITLSDEIAFVLEGNRGQNPNLDIKVKYKKNGINKLLFPSHIHWIVDMIIKQKSDANLTKNFITLLYEEYQASQSLVGRDRTYETIKNEIKSFTDEFNISVYGPLNQYGYYNVDFIAVLIKLFSIAEKTSTLTAFMFESLLHEFTKDNPDYFMLVAVAANVQGARF